MPKITWVCGQGHEIEVETFAGKADHPAVCNHTHLEVDSEEMEILLITCKSTKFVRKYKAPAIGFRGAGFYTTDNPKE